MQRMEVAAGVVRAADGRVLLCRRTGRLGGLWEFPGGKREPGESFAACLKRELMEELSLQVEVGEPLGEILQNEEEKELRLVFLPARPVNARAMELHVHSQVEWVNPHELEKYALCPADRAFLKLGLL